MRLVLSLLALAGTARAERLTPIADLLAHKPDYDRKFACVAGATTNLFTKVSRHGHPYFTIWLNEGDAKLKVFGYGKPPFVEGEKIEACGVFAQEHEHSSRVFYDELSAKVILRGASIGAGKVILTANDARLAPQPGRQP